MMKKIKAYKVVSFSGKIVEFQSAVNKWIISGWQPIGGMAVDCVAGLPVKYHQSMVLYNSTEEEQALENIPQWKLYKIAEWKLIGIDPEEISRRLRLLELHKVRTEALEHVMAADMKKDLARPEVYKQMRRGMPTIDF